MDLSKLTDEELLAMRAAPRQDLSHLSDEQLMAMRQVLPNPQQNQPQTYASDILENSLPSFFRGANALAGMPGDVSQAARSAINWAMGPGTVAPQSPTYPTSEQYQNALEKQIGSKLYEAQTFPGKVVGRMEELAPGAAIGGIAGGGTAGSILRGTAETALGGVGLREAGKAMGLDPWAQNALDFIGSIGGPYVMEHAFRAAQTTLSHMLGKVPTQGNLKASYKQIYGDADFQNTIVDRTVAQELKNNVNGLLADKDYYATVYGDGKLKEALKMIDDAVTKSEKPLTLGDIQDLRSKVGELVHRRNPGGAPAIYATIQDFINGPLQSGLSGPNVERALAKWKAGDVVFKRWLGGGALDQLKYLAEDTPGGYAVGLNNQYRALDRRIVGRPGTPPDPSVSRLFTPEGKQAIHDMARGSFMRRLIEDVGSFSPFQRNKVAAVASALGQSGLGYGLGTPVGIGTAAGSTAARIGSKLGTWYQGGWQVPDLVRLGHPLLEAYQYPWWLMPNAAQSARGGR